MSFIWLVASRQSFKRHVSKPIKLIWIWTYVRVDKPCTWHYVLGNTPTYLCMNQYITVNWRITNSILARYKTFRKLYSSAAYICIIYISACMSVCYALCNCCAVCMYGAVIDHCNLRPICGWDTNCVSTLTETGFVGTWFLKFLIRNKTEDKLLICHIVRLSSGGLHRFCCVYQVAL